MQLIGLARLGRDAELRVTPQGEQVCNLALAYNFGRKQTDGKKPSQWIDAALWGKLAESLQQYLTKGKQVCVTIDDVHIEEYESKGVIVTKLVGRISSIELAGDSSTKQAATVPSPQQRQTPQRKAEPQQTAPYFEDDDIPF